MEKVYISRKNKKGEKVFSAKGVLDVANKTCVMFGCKNNNTFFYKDLVIDYLDKIFPDCYEATVIEKRKVETFDSCKNSTGFENRTFVNEYYLTIYKEDKEDNE